MNKIEKNRRRQIQAKRGEGKFCPCCCTGNEQGERRFVNRARRRVGKAICHNWKKEWNADMGFNF